MRKMNEYERHAYLYSAWSALLVPCLLTIWITWSILPSELDTFHMIQKTLGIVASSVCCSRILYPRVISQYLKNDISISDV